ncbi:MAG: sugar phosphate isomerase/epimerase [Gammaproteobacteria bacterium]|nr:sugar phosphate isomerase/epimerase [Gammaproteobacteria bacterium]
MQFSLAHLTLLACSPPEFTEIAARAGYDFVSLRPIALGTPGEPLHPLGSDRALRKRTQAALAATGLKLLDIELARIFHGCDIRSYLPALEAGAALGARHVLTSAWVDDRTFVLEKYIELCELAAPFNLTVDFEFVPFASFRNLIDVVGIVGASRCDNAGVCIDTLHFDRSRCRVTDLDMLPRKWFHYAQICDGPAEFTTEEIELKFVAREGRLYLGEGGINVAGILARMPLIPYSIELPNRQRLQALGPEDFARQCLETTRQYLTEHPRTDATPAAADS